MAVGREPDQGYSWRELAIVGLDSGFPASVPEDVVLPLLDYVSDQCDTSGVSTILLFRVAPPH